ncbi:MAG: hypothetical protein IIU28_00865 [Lachnospiraceae bacterium]|nr:hypothetical protein [Lachnospiraceae bacterium]
MMCHKSTNILTRCFAVLLFCAFLLLSMPTVVLAAGSTSISLSSNSVSKGDTLTVTVIGSQSSTLSLKYDNTMLELVNGGSATASGNVLTVSASSATYKFRAIRAGNAGIVASSDSLSGSSVYVPIADTSATESTTTEEKQEKQEKASPEESKDTGKSEKKSKKTKDSKKTSAKDKTETQKTEPAVTTGKASSEDLSFREVITDRRVMAVIIILVAIILVLIIQLILRAHENDEENEEMLLAAEKFFGGEQEEEKPATAKMDFKEKSKEGVTPEKSKESVSSERSVKREIPSEKPVSRDQVKNKTTHNQADLTMPKAPKSAGQRLDVMDLNDL